MRRPEAETDQLEEAAAGFRRFFTEVQSRFPERAEVIERLELALLSGEHLLLTGPPGSGKSALAAAVLGAIRDASGAPSLYARQLTESTVQSDLVGPVDFKVLTETGRTVHLLDEGMLGARFAFLDEVFDGRDMLLRSILNVLHERELKHGAVTTRGLLMSAVLTSNRTLTEVLERAPDLMVAFADRIAFSAYVPHAFAFPRNRSRMLAQALEGQRPTLTSILPLAQLHQLQLEVAKVSVPAEVSEGLEALTDALEARLHEAASRHAGYRPTRIFSQRGLVKAQEVLRAAVVRDRIWRAPGRAAEARLEDLAALRAAFTLGGPSPEALELLEPATLDPREQAQLRFIRLEHDAFGLALEEALHAARGGIDAEAQQLGLSALRTMREALPEHFDPSLHLDLLTRLVRALLPGPRHPDNRKTVLEEASAQLHALSERLSQEASVASAPAERVLAVVEAAVALLGAGASGLVVDAAWPRELGAQLTLAGELLLGELEAAALASAEQPLSTLDALSTDAALRIERIERASFGLRQLAPTVAPEVGALASLRREAGQKLRRSVEGAFAADGLSADSLSTRVEVIERLEPKLLAVSPALGSVRKGLLEPLVRAWSLRAVSAEGGWVAELTLRLRETLRLCARHGISPRGIFEALEPLVQERLGTHVEELRARLLKYEVPKLSQTLSSGAYDVYRQQLTGTGLEQEGEALERLEALLREGGVSAEWVTPTLREEVWEVSLEALEGRVAFLRNWQVAIASRLPSAEETLRPADAAGWLARLIDSRLPLLTLREGELRRLEHALRTLAMSPSAEARVAQALEEVEALAGEVESLGQRLLEQRRT